MSSKIYGNTIPRGWINFNIGKDAFVKARIGWQSLRAQEYLEAGNYALVTGTDFSEGIINWNACQYVSKWRYDQDIDIQLKENDVLVTKDGTIGKIGLVKNLPCPATLNSGIYVIRPKSANVNPKFLFYMFMSKYFDDFIRIISAGSTITHLYQKDFVNFSFPLPPKAEQERIAQMLGDMDDLISAKCELLDKKRAIKQAAAQQLLTPKPHWHTATLGEIAKFRRGSFPQPYGLAKWYGGSGAYPFVQVADVANKNFKLNEITNQTISKIAQQFSVFVPSGTVLVTLQGSIGRVAITQYDSYVDRTLAIFENYLLDIDKIFFAYKLHEKFAIESQKAPGGIIKTITKDEFTKFEISYPNFTEQTKITQILSDMDDEISALQDEIEKLKMIK